MIFEVFNSTAESFLSCSGFLSDMEASEKLSSLLHLERSSEFRGAFCDDLLRRELTLSSLSSYGSIKIKEMQVYNSLDDLQPKLIELYAGPSAEYFKLIAPTCSLCS